jgi:hypothetical protein
MRIVHDPLFVTHDLPYLLDLQIRTRLHPPPVSETRAAAAHSFAQHSARHTALHDNDLFMAVYCSYTVRILGQQICFVVPSPTGICLAGPEKTHLVQ